MGPGSRKTHNSQSLDPHNQNLTYSISFSLNPPPPPPPPPRVYGSHIWSPLATHSPPLLLCYTTVCAIINSTLVVLMKSHEAEITHQISISVTYIVPQHPLYGNMWAACT